jgi:hypothetical protein
MALKCSLVDAKAVVKSLLLRESLVKDTVAKSAKGKMYPFNKLNVPHFQSFN